jgi:hypothetical protein
MGIPVNDRYLFALKFADDQVMIAQDQFDLEFMLRRLQNAYESWGLTLNFKNTEYLAINSKETDNLILEERIEMKQVDYSKYLGTIINKTEGIGKEEIINRIDQSKKIITCLNKIWWDPHIRNDTQQIYW